MAKTSDTGLRLAARRLLFGLPHGQKTESGQKRGCLVVNNKWWDRASNSPLTCSCSPNPELLIIKSCPFYLSQDFTVVIALFELPEAVTQQQALHSLRRAYYYGRL